MQSMMGKCEYCGAEMGVMAQTQAEANEIASEKCDCANSRIAEKRRCMRERLQELIGDKCEELSFTPVEADVYSMIETAADMVLEGRVQNAVFKVNGTVITIKTGEKTKVSRKYTYEQKGEVE